MVGTFLPWVSIDYALPGQGSSPPYGHYTALGVEIGAGRITLAAGILILLLGLAMLIVPARRRWLGAGAVAATAIVAAGLTDLYPERDQWGLGLGFLVTAVGVLLGVTGTLLTWPGSVRQPRGLLERLGLLAGFYLAVWAALFLIDALVPPYVPPYSPYWL